MKFVSFILSIVFMFFIYVPVQAQQGPFTVKQQQAIDLNGDGRKEEVKLIARKDQYHETAGNLMWMRKMLQILKVMMELIR